MCIYTPPPNSSSVGRAKHTHEQADVLLYILLCEAASAAMLLLHLVYGTDSAAIWLLILVYEAASAASSL